MSRNRKQPNKSNATVNRSTKNQPTEADTVKANLDAVKQSVKKQTEQVKQQAQPGQTATTDSKPTSTAATKKVTGASSTTQSAKKMTETADVSKRAEKDNQQSGENKTTSAEPKKTTQAKTTAQKPRPTPQPQSPKPRQKINYAPPEKSPKKGGGLVAGLALLLGVCGVGLGAYSFNELRHLKSSLADGHGLKEQVNHLTAELTALSKKDPVAGIKGQLSTLTSQQKNLVASEERVNQRLARVEQMQQGVSQSIKEEIDTVLSANLQTVDSLLEKVKSIELSQQGLSKNLSEVNAASSATQMTGMQYQEVGYLLRMADYKIQSEADVLGARGLLKSAESKLLIINQGQPDTLVEAIREKVIQLSGVKPVDTNALLSRLKAASREVTHLQAKSAIATGKAMTIKTEEGDMLGKLTSALASGIKYTPKDPNQIDISAETILIEKRLIQADIKTAELAVQSHNKVLLAESIRSILDSLDKSFVADETANTIKDSLTTIAQSELETVMPDLTELVKQFEIRQVQ